MKTIKTNKSGKAPILGTKISKMPYVDSKTGFHTDITIKNPLAC